MYCKHTDARKKNHASFTHSADTHTPAEHSFEPAAEIQVALDHFSCVFFFFISICSCSTSLFFFRGVIYTASLSTPPLCLLFPSSSLLSPSVPSSLLFCSHCLSCLEPTEVFEMQVCLHAHSDSATAVVFSCKTPPPLYTAGACSHTAQAYAGSSLCIHYRLTITGFSC